jgi:hypothetical protein
VSKSVENFPRRTLGVPAPHLQTPCLTSHFGAARPIAGGRTSAQRVAAVCRS